jgi:predicted nucleic acid-binding protein
MILIDSSVIIAAFRTNEIHHQDALDILSTANNILLLDSVVSEIATVLKMRENFEVASQCLSFLTQNTDIEIMSLSKNEFHQTCHMFINTNNKLSFVDTSLIIIKKTKNIPLATFDKEIIQYIS